MKTAHSLVTLGCVVLSVSHLLAENDITREMNRLQDEYAKSVAAATEPLSRRYQASLEQLLKRAQLSKDTESATKIQDQLTALQAAAVSPNAKPHHTRESLHQLLISSEWTWSAKPEIDRSNTTHVTFTQDQFVMSGKPVCSYKIIDPFTVDLDKKILKFADDYKSFEVSNWSEGNPRFGHRIF
jgi:hypothetical protein